MMNIERLEEKIVYFRNAIPDPEKLLNELDIANNNESVYSVISPWSPWVAGDKEHVYGERRFVRGSSINDRPGNTAYIIDTIEEAMGRTALEYASILNIDKDVNFGKDFVINKYATNENMGSHVDWNEQHPDLEYSFVIYLNDNYLGGEIYWKNHGVEVKPEAGSIILFPSKEPYLHGVKKITKGNKIYIPHYWKHTAL